LFVRTSTQPGANGWFAGAIALLLVGVWCQGAAAQSVESDAVRDKLSTKIHLRLGKTTLTKVAAAIAQQTGLKVEPADYVSDREMIADMEGVSARAALNALSELNDWKWRETPEHAIAIARHLARPPQVAAAIPRIVQSAIPKDTRAFLGIATPSEDLSQYTSPWLSNTRGVHGNLVTKTVRLLRDTQGDLYSSLPADAVQGTPIPYEKLTETQRRDLIVQIAFRQIISLDEYLLSDLLPFVRAPELAQIEFYRNGLTVGQHGTVNGVERRTGFPAVIQP
jgi:hypothetical protein